MKTAVAAMFIAFLPGCVFGAEYVRDTVRARFAADTECPKTSVGITDLPGSAYRAEGCGRLATYVCPVMDGLVTSCMRESGPRSTGSVDAGA